MKTHQRGLYLSALAALAVPAAALAQLQVQPPGATPPVDVVSDVVITSRNTPTDKVDIIVARMPRVARCLSADTWSRDPTRKFNQAYYEELTGQADYYDQIRGAPPKVNFRYPLPLHPGDKIFASLDGPMVVPGAQAIFASPMNAASGRLPDITCEKRDRMENNTNFARALAMLDKGEFAEALPLMTEAWSELSGSPMGGEAALMIAGVYLRDEGVPRDVPQAIAWLERAATLPVSPRATYRYDPEEPNRYFSIASEAASALVRIYMSGAGGGPKDEALARRWVEEAVRAKHVPAVKVLGDMHYTGYGGPVNLRSALQHYDLAAKANHVTSMIYAAEMYQAGEGAKVSYSKAVYYYDKASQLDDGRGDYGLARFADGGRVKGKALGHYVDAARKGNAKALTALGTYYYRGEQIGKDLAAARALFEGASFRNDPDGMVNFSAMLIKGEGGPADPVRAWAWLTIASTSGREDAGPALAALERKMSAEELARARAMINPAPKDLVAGDAASQ